MGFMGAWERWAQKQYDNWGGKLQNKYDAYRDLKAPSWYVLVTGKIWGKLDSATKKLLNSLVQEFCGRFGDIFARKIIEKITAEIENTLTD